MDAASFLIGMVVGVGVSAVAFALTLFIFPRLFRSE
jgi:hypothetical protein